MQKNLPFLQIARGIAALIVVFHHITGSEQFYFGYSPFGGVFTAGWNAVDFFFVLSGFIIYYVHGKNLGQKQVWKSYLLKRLIRIYPIYWLIAILTLVLIITGNNSVSKTSLVDISSNPVYIFKSLFLFPQQTLPFLTVAWSLCYEVFFYIVFGFAILGGRKLLWIASFSYLAIFAGRFAYPPAYGPHSPLHFLGSSFHIEFIMGVLAAWYFKTRRHTGHGMQFWIPGVLIFAGTWAGSLLLPHALGKFSMYSRFFYGAASAYIILGIAAFKTGNKGGVQRFSLLLGDSSYTLYLIHPVMLGILFKAAARMGFHANESPWFNYGVFALATTLCIMAGFLIHSWIEKPVLTFLNKPIQKSAAVDENSDHTLLLPAKRR